MCYEECQGAAGRFNINIGPPVAISDSAAALPANKV
ncbi:hypothetical protein LTSEADE_2354, partial [Salmonella enterica subsp. enterica serovar Adelaide str. A4-669]